MTVIEDKQLAEYIKNATNILVFTGAGISTGSGIQDFRGPQGVWKKRQPVYYQSFLSSNEARMEYWDYKLEGWESFRSALPNEIHYSITRLEEASKLLMVVTQNVDGLHSLAGTSLELLVELHGTNRKIECQSCYKLSDPEPHFSFFKKNLTPPLCDCGGFLKPATISFGQNLKEKDIQNASNAANEADMVISLGSTLSVYPASSIPLMAAERGVPYVIINRGRTEHDDHPSVSLRIEGDVLEIFPSAVNNALE